MHIVRSAVDVDPISQIEAMSRVEFSSLNAKSWDENATFWLHEPGQDGFRLTLFRSTITLIQRETAREKRATVRVLDLGCGEGTFLTEVVAAIPASQASGIDRCRRLIEAARRAAPSATVRLADLEAGASLPFSEQDIVTCLLVLIELASPRHALSLAYGTLRPGGLLIFAVLDPAVETYRYMTQKRTRADTRLLTVDGELAVGSHFPVGGAVSPSPYFRFLRPVHSYLEAAISCGFVIETIAASEGCHPPFMSEPRAVIIAARRPRATVTKPQYA